jgi:hypothetical protein
MAARDQTFAEVLRELSFNYEGPVDERDLCAAVLARRPSRARDPQAAVRQVLRTASVRHGWLRLGDGRAVPTHVAQQGICFRVTPSLTEMQTALLSVGALEPFVATDGPLTVEGPEGQSLSLPLVETPDELLEVGADVHSFDTRRWLARHKVAAGDSMLVTVCDARARRVRLEHEPAVARREELIAERDAELADAIFTRLRAAREPILTTDALLLPIFYEAAWRAAYPGSPWRDVVGGDLRMGLISGIGVALREHSLPGFLFDESRFDDRDWVAIDEPLFAAIDALQSELHESRAQDRHAGIWNGTATRASANEPLDEDSFDEDDSLDGELFDDLDGGELFDDDDFAEASRFGASPHFAPAGETTGLSSAELTRRLFDALSEDEIRQLQEADAVSAELFIAARLNDLLVRAPSLFVPLRPGAALALDEPSDVGVVDGEWLDSDEWEADEDWEADEGDDLDGSDFDTTVARSYELMSGFYESILADGRSEQTASARANDLWVYADFLARYYGRALDEGDYATLDECLFFFLPRKIINSSPRMARELCTSIKQFYAFLRQSGVVADDAFAQAIWRRRDQVGRLIELYDRVSSESPNFEQLFRRLFSPFV